MNEQKKLIVVGGGAAGFFVAVNAARMNPELKVIILEKSSKLLSKVKISGGGRCNVTHAGEDIAAMAAQYPRGDKFIRKTFYHFFTHDTIKWFSDRDVQLKTEDDGRMFPVTDNSQTIIDCLLKEANRYRVEIRMNSEVKLIRRDNKFTVTVGVVNELECDFVCVACGGFPKSSMFDWLRLLSHAVEEPVPSLFTFNIRRHPITKLMGISVERVRVRIPGEKLGQEGSILITHWGLSGPVILRLSAWGARQLAIFNWHFDIVINWLPDFNEHTLQQQLQQTRLASGAATIMNKNSLGLPQRLWEYLAGHSGIDRNTRWADLKSREQNLFVKNLCASEFRIEGKTTFKEEFVTAGGVKPSEVDPNTMMSKKISGLFFAGEVLDVDGITGGYNFQHAWTSGYIAASGITAANLK